ncbi:MAG: ABC transporter ATP-binding protein [Acidimicrobiia bacterium]
MSDVELRAVSKRFGSRAGAVQALDPVDLRIPDGQVVAIVGPSGCGKSTLLRAVAGLVPPTTGDVVLGGRPVWRGARPDAAALGQLSLVFQDANLLPWLTVEDNVALPLRLRGVRRTERRAAAAVLCERTGVDDFRRHRPRELSIGMRQRVALARALVSDPGLLLLDEPFASLDAITRDALNLELQRVLLTSRCTCLLVTHSIAEAAFLADRVLVFSGRPGRIVRDEPITFERPRPMELHHTPAFQDLVRDLRTTLQDAG